MSKRIPWNKDKTGIYTDEQRKRISDTLKKKGIKPPSRKGSKWSKEQREKAKKSFAKADMSWWKWGKTPNRGKEWEENVRKALQHTRRKVANRGELTDIEKIVDVWLHKNKIPHQHEFPVGRRSMDFYLPTEHLFLECDSEYWHTEEGDLAKDKDFRNSAWSRMRLIRLKEKELKNGSWIKRLPEIWGAKRGV